MSSVTRQREAFGLRVSSVSRQNGVRAAGISPTVTVGELVEGLIPKMGLSTHDPQGRPVAYQVLLERSGRHLHASEIAGDVLEPDDHIILQPNIMAGGE